MIGSAQAAALLGAELPADAWSRLEAAAVEVHRVEAEAPALRRAGKAARAADADIERMIRSLRGMRDVLALAAACPAFGPKVDRAAQALVLAALELRDLADLRGAATVARKAAGRALAAELVGALASAGVDAGPDRTARLLAALADRRATADEAHRWLAPAGKGQA